MPRRMNNIFTKNLLTELYVIKDMKTTEIAKMFNSKPQTVSKYLKLNEIKIKGIKYYNIRDEICFNNEQYEFFDGLMISDGSLYINNSGGRKRNALLSCAFKYKEFSNYINKFLNLNGNIHKKIHKSDRYKSGLCVQYGLMSQNNILFTKERQRWYPNDKKIIPRDFRFSPISMNIMYLSDGYLIRKKGYWSVRLCTNAFERDNIDIIINHLKNVNIYAHITPDNQIMMNTLNSKKFLDYIGDCPVKCYKYKWG